MANTNERTSKRTDAPLWVKLVISVIIVGVLWSVAPMLPALLAVFLTFVLLGRIM